MTEVAFSKIYTPFQICKIERFLQGLYLSFGEENLALLVLMDTFINQNKIGVAS